MRLVFAVLGLLFASQLQADPFTQPKGSSTLSFTASVWEFDSFYDSNGEERELGTEVTQSDFIVGFDYGLSDRLTLALSLPWSESERDVLGDDPGTFATNDGASDAQLGLKWRLNAASSPTAFALLVGFKWPGDYEEDILNAPGDGNFDADLALSVGRQTQRLTLSLDVGYRVRSGNPADEFFANLDGSILLGNRFVAFGSLNWVDSRDGIAIDFSQPIFFDFSRTEEDVTRLTAGGLISFNARVSAFAGWSHSVDGQSTALGDQFSIGTIFSF